MGKRRRRSEKTLYSRGILMEVEIASNFNNPVHPE
jgi:hypothetical protein